MARVINNKTLHLADEVEQLRTPGDRRYRHDDIIH